MKRLLLKYIDLVKSFFIILVCTKKKIFLMDPPPHPNLGDQAQLICTYKWLAENYPEYKVFNLPILRNTLNDAYSKAEEILKSKKVLATNTYFKEYYWDRLKENLK